MKILKHIKVAVAMLVVGTGGLVLFPGTPLIEDEKKRLFTPISEKEMLVELKTFV